MVNLRLPTVRIQFYERESGVSRHARAGPHARRAGALARACARTRYRRGSVTLFFDCFLKRAQQPAKPIDSSIVVCNKGAYSTDSPLPESQSTMSGWSPGSRSGILSRRDPTRPIQVRCELEFSGPSSTNGHRWDTHLKVRFAPSINRLFGANPAIPTNSRRGVRPYVNMALIWH